MYKQRQLKKESIKTENSTRTQSDIKFTKEGDAAYDEWSKAYDEFRVIKPRSKQ